MIQRWIAPGLALLVAVAIGCGKTPDKDPKAGQGGASTGGSQANNAKPAAAGETVMVKLTTQGLK